MHGDKVVSMRVPAEDVAWAGTDRNEYFYVPHSSITEGLIKAHNNYTGLDVTIFHNPSHQQIKNLFTKFPYGLRGLLSPTAGLYVWDGEMLHDQALPFLDVPLSPYPTHIYILPDRVFIPGDEDDFDDLTDETRQFDKPLRRIFGDEVPYRIDYQYC